VKSIKPPTLFLLLLSAMAALSWGLPLARPAPLLLRVLGLLPLGVGLGLTVAGSRLFERVGTNICTWDDPARFVRTGPFAYTRNPMYLGFLVALVGLAMLLGTASAFVGPGAFWAAAEWVYIPYEERRMAARFGAEYDAYRRRVRRWLGARWSTAPSTTVPSGEGRR
jgi:protein-S-isoprenylcysteine O-methyltransferase Ste14